MPYTSNPLLPKARRLAVNLVLVKKLPASSVATKYAVHRSTIYRWIKKGCSDRKSFIYSKSSKPHSHPNQISQDLRKLILSTRIDSKNRCAEVVMHSLKLKNISVSPSTIKRVIRQEGLSNTKRNIINYDTKFKRPFVQNPGDLVQIDTIHFIGNDGNRFFIYVAIDLCSRYIHAQYSKSINTKTSIKFSSSVIKHFPFKIKVIQTDNGPEFQQSLKFSLNNKGIKLRHTRPRKPNDNAHVERVIRTIQEEAFLSKLPNTKNINQILDNYIHFYNNNRPHLGINCLTPNQFLSHRS